MLLGTIKTYEKPHFFQTIKVKYESMLCVPSLWNPDCYKSKRDVCYEQVMCCNMEYWGQSVALSEKMAFGKFLIITTHITEGT